MPQGGKGVAAPIIFKKRKKGKKKGENQEKMRGEITKSEKINQNAVYKWVKTDEFLRG